MEKHTLKFIHQYDYRMALNFVKTRHPGSFENSDPDLTISFFSKENKDEMKRLYSILGYKCADLTN